MFATFTSFVNLSTFGYARQDCLLLAVSSDRSTLYTKRQLVIERTKGPSSLQSSAHSSSLQPVDERKQGILFFRYSLIHHIFHYHNSFLFLSLEFPDMSQLINVLRTVPYSNRVAVVDVTAKIHSYFTCNLLIGLAILLSYKQFGGSPIECMLPLGFSGAWSEYAEK